MSDDEQLQADVFAEIGHDATITMALAIYRADPSISQVRLLLALVRCLAKEKWSLMDGSPRNEIPELVSTLRPE